MSDLPNFLVEVGNMLANGEISVEDAPKFLGAVRSIVLGGEGPTDADWAYLRAYIRHDDGAESPEGW
jgi:hypothetical protein